MRWRILVLGVALFAMGCGNGAAPGEILIVDLNILHGILDEDPAAQPFDRMPERIEIIADALARLRPHIITLQEVFLSTERGYPDVRGILLEAVGFEYTAVFGDIVGNPIDTGALGQMTLTRLPVVGGENHPLPLVTVPRSVVKVTVEAGNGVIDVYNAHLTGTSAGPGALVEVRDLLNFLQASRSGPNPVVLAGDFNALPGDPSIQAILEAGFIDTLALAGNATCIEAGDPGCTNSTIPLGNNPADLADVRIDYVFLLPGEEPALVPLNAELFLNAPVSTAGGLLWASDHIGVALEVALDE